jgi:quercetin dioxygenase-like cupin family protein
MSQGDSEIITGDGYAVAGDLGAHGEGPGIPKLRKELGVTAFGVNAIVLPPGYDTGAHAHEEQEELYFVHSGEIEIAFGDGSVHRLSSGGIARVDPQTPRQVRNVGDGEAVYLCVGGKDGYVGRDGVPAGDLRADG